MNERESKRVVAVLDAYLAELEAGRAPPRGELLARHPDLAEDLEACLASLAFVQGGVSDAAPEAEAITGGLLGDCRILREVGRGGMGVVYEAEQVSLGRRVALKVLPFAAIMDDRQLQRFKNEAQAAAHLHHAHIVPVYSVGCDRGVHHFAMQYIEGLTIQQTIREMRALENGDGNGDSSSAALTAITGGSSPRSASYCRGVARLGIQAAEALDHAHQQGVVHRDIKPANLIVDASGHLWIMDFGLASFTSRPGLTMTGDIVGTVRYMSPEQALAKRVPVDHRTDIYSLSITLYELLTLEEAFQGDDPHKVIQEIASKDPKSARSLNPAVPGELETILIKAMAKDPAERYETAQELADDLERFLENKPIQARRPGLVKRAGKWARRHQPAVWSAALILLMGVIALSVSTLLVQDAYQAETTERQRAEENLTLARKAVDRMFTKIAEGELTDAPGMQELRRELLQDALAFYKEFLATNAGHAALRRETADAYHRVGQIHYHLGDREAAEQAFRSAMTLLQQLAQESPDEHVLALVATQRKRADTLIDLRRPGEAETQARQALETARDSAEARPQETDCWLEVGRCLQTVGNSIKYEDPEQAAGHYRQAITIVKDRLVTVSEEPEVMRVLGAGHFNLAESLRVMKQVRGAEGAYRQALGVYDQLADVCPEAAEYRYLQASTLVQLADMIRTRLTPHLGPRKPEVAELYKRAITITKELVKAYPSVPRYEGKLDRAVRMCVLVLDDVEERRALLEWAVRFRGWEGCYIDLALSYGNCRDESLRDLTKAALFAEKSVELTPKQFAPYVVLGIVRYRARDYEGAVAALERARDLPGPPYDKFPTGAAYFKTWFYLAMAHWQLAEQEEALKCFNEGVAALEARHSMWPNKRRRARLEAAVLLGVDEADQQRWKDAQR